MSWFDDLLPASFNGVPFLIEGTDRESGRRLVAHEFPLRNDPSQEDLGRLPRVFSIKAYVAGDLWVLERSLLETALENSSTVGTLIHPTYGILNVWVGKIRSSETRTVGGYATIDIEFSLDGGTASPLSITDAVSTLLAGLNSLVPFLEDAYIASVGLEILSGVVATLVGNQLSNADAQFNAMAQSTVSGITSGFAANPTDSTTTASAVTAAFAAAANNVIAAQPVQPALEDPVAGVTSTQPLSADPSGGLLALASFGSTLPTQPSTAVPALGVAQAALISLIQGAALVAVLTVYAQIDWQSANQAQAAAEQLQCLLDVQVAAAADAGNFDLFRAWRAISAQARAQMAQDAQNLPSLATYSVAGVMPALALAQRLYQDGTQAPGLVALNDVPHPIFMPPTGSWLRPAA
ncbi:MAG TPA: DNA circularization N-terminal domain-containing protein [Acidocella sp.]|jgi:prophage DNA circulation protein|uniref:DNA circularization protein n=1 Tax=Acidocella sp. TaxID=50710 RepID=UPI002BED0ADA|nr:DNA circularization N-terminal domain-containing protein [Acidocella sp.]HVE20657.1 DNA circularization N-terminal domain-containing protein [Acidocella sp.]